MKDTELMPVHVPRAVAHALRLCAMSEKATSSQIAARALQAGLLDAVINDEDGRVRLESVMAATFDKSPLVTLAKTALLYPHLLTKPQAVKWRKLAEEDIWRRGKRTLANLKIKELRARG